MPELGAVFDDVCDVDPTWENAFTIRVLVINRIQLATVTRDAATGAIRYLLARTNAEKPCHIGIGGRCGGLAITARIKIR